MSRSRRPLPFPFVTALCVFLFLAGPWPAAPAAADPPPASDELTEGSAATWGGFAEGASAAVYDDASLVQVGAGSLRFVTDGGSDTWLWNPIGQDASWDLSGTYGMRLWVRAETLHDFQNNSPWIRICTSSTDYVELHSTTEILNAANRQWTQLVIPWSGDIQWERSIEGAPNFTDVHYIEIHADTWDSGFTLWFDGMGFDTDPSSAWPMKGRDIWHTGRAEYDVPDERMNGSFFDVFAWQKPSPGSPDEGALSSTSMVFADGVGPAGAGVVVGGYHWPKGVQGMDRNTGELLWYGNPSGGETIGRESPAFSNDGHTVYVVNDATESTEFPNGHPLMAFASLTGPSAYRHNGLDTDPDHLGMNSPTVAPDGRVFLHGWVDRPYAATDDGSRLFESWAAQNPADCGYSDPTLDWRGDSLRVVIGSRSGAVTAYDGDTGQQLWSTATPTVDATVTIDPNDGRIFVAAGGDDIHVVGLDRDGDPLWSDTALLVYDYQEGINNPQRAQSAGCLSFDGATYYFQTSSEQGDGVLYAIDTHDGSVLWTYDTGSSGWEMVSSSPIVTQDSVLVVGNNEGGTYFAIWDDGTPVVLDTYEVDGSARATATLAPDGRLYLPLRTLWTTSNGDGDAPSFQVENLFSSFDLRAGAQVVLAPPGGQKTFAGNHRVRVEWREVPDPGGHFDHFAIYRDTAPFASVDGMTPIGQVTGADPVAYEDSGADNGISYYYAVTTVTQGGAEVTTVTSVGPRTCWDETDLQAVCVARTPRFPRYLPTYTDQEVIEPSGFGPYWFGAATGLGGGQSDTTQRWPHVDDTVTYRAVIRNRGTNTFNGTVYATWEVDGSPSASASPTLSLEPGDTASLACQMSWDDQIHEVAFSFTTDPGAESRADNNAIVTGSKSVGFLTYIDRTRIEEFRESTADFPLAETDDFIDWLNRHMARFNGMFDDAGTGKRVHYEILAVLDDDDPDPGIDTDFFAVFPFRYRVGEGDVRLSGYYTPADDIDYGLLHEMGHQLGLIDIYRLDLPPEQNQVSGSGYSAVADLMNGCSPFLSQHSAGAMEHWLNTAHGYYGQYLYGLPDQVTMCFLGHGSTPLDGATVTVYQMVERSGLGQIITPQVKAQGMTDASGEYVLPNVPIDTLLVPTTYTGDRLRPNPFGYVAVLGTNGLLLFKIEHHGFTDYAWLDITEVNNAYWAGQTGNAAFTRDLALGGVVQVYPPDDMAELNVASWDCWAEGGTCTLEDSEVAKVGSGSIRLATDGGFDNYLRYPGDRLARWNLSDRDSLRIWCYAENPQTFQDNSPWIRLMSNGGYIELHATSEILNDAIGQWVEFKIPLAGDASWERTVFGEPDIAAIQSLDIHADSWGLGFSLWVDGVGFIPPASSTGTPEGPERPARLALHPNSPNPFRSATSLRFDLPDPERVVLNIFSISGRLVRTVAAQSLPAGRHRIDWDGRDDAGRPLAAGVYVLRLKAGVRTMERKLVLAGR